MSLKSIASEDNCDDTSDSSNDEWTGERVFHVFYYIEKYDLKWKQQFSYGDISTIFKVMFQVYSKMLATRKQAHMLSWVLGERVCFCFPESNIRTKFYSNQVTCVGIPAVNKSMEIPVYVFLRMRGHITGLTKMFQQIS